MNNAWKYLLSIIIFLGLASYGLFIEKPQGSISGTVFLKFEEGFYDSLNIRDYDARVIASGPVTRASYVNSKGNYKIDGLPVGKYSSRIRARGYSSQSKWNIEVKEARETYVESIELSHLTPSLWLTSNFTTFTTKDHPYFWFTAYGIDDVKLKLYKFDPEKLLSTKSKNQPGYTEFILNERYYGEDKFINDIIKDKTPVHTWSRKINYGVEDGATVPFKIDNEIPEGAYILLVEGNSPVNNKNYSHPYWFAVSKYGLITKQDPTKILVRAVNLETLEPVKDFNVNVYDQYKNNKLLSSAKTDDAGLAEIKYSKNRTSSDTNLIIFGQKDASVALNGSSTWYYPSQDYKVYSYTDRPIYRPGQTVYFKGIARKIENTGLKALAGQSVKITITNPDDETIKEINLRTNQFGSYNGIVELPKEAKLGNYNINTSIGQNASSCYFEIAEYRKPEYKVEIIPGSTVVQSGNQANATIKATYFFGYPVKNAKVKYTVYASPDWGMQWKLLPRPDYYSFFDDWEEDSNYYGYSSGNIIAEGYAQTDDNGEAKISFDTKKVQVSNDDFYSYGDSLPQDYKVEAEVTDISRQTAIGSGHFNVISGAFALFIEPEYYVYTQNQDIKVKVNTINYKKEFVTEKVTLQLQKWQWDEDNYQYTKPQIIQEKTITTNSPTGTYAELHIPDDATTQDYRIVAVSKDDKGNEISTTQYIWLSNTYNSGKNSQFKPDIKLNLDKKVYKAGDVAKLVIISPVKNVKALITIEGSKLYKYQTVDIKSNSGMINIPITKEYMPNAYVSVSLVGPQKQFYEIQKRLLVSPEDNFLNIEIKADKTKYKPHDTVKYTVKATDKQGKPVKAELSLGVVDESIYSIREDWTEDIRKFFYSQRENLVNTVYSFTQNNSAGGDKIQPRLRKDFKDTAFWNANITTNSNGIAKVSFVLPDNLTTWRTTVRAVTQDTKIAAVTDKILVTKDIIIRLALPRFYTVGDNAVLAAIVHNYTDKKQKIKLKMNFPTNMSVDGFNKSTEKWLDIDSQGQAKNDWKIKINEAGNAIIQAYALSSTIEGDAIEQNIEILPFGVPVKEYLSGNLSDDLGQKILQENINNEITPGSLSWKIRIAPTNISILSGSLDYLINFPYGCTEQTMSSFMPVVAVSSITKGLKVSLSEKTKVKLPSVIDEGLNRLYKFQHSDGSWGWWEYDDANPYLTAYVLHGLTYPKSAGIKIKEEVVNNGTNWIKDHLNTKEAQELSKSNIDIQNHAYLQSQESISDLCYESYVLALYKTKSPVINNLYQNRKNIDNLGLAYLTLAYSELGNKNKASECVKLLLNHKDKKSDNDFYNENEVNAVILRALIKTNADEATIDSYANTLIDNRIGGHWNNTKTSANVILALSDYAVYFAEKLVPDYDTVVKINGQEFSKLHFDKSNMFDPEKVIEIPIDLIKSENNITIEKTGLGKLYYNSELSYYQLYKPEETIPAVNDEGFKITKEFYRLESTTDKDGNIVYKEYRLIGPARAGEILLVKLTLENAKDKEYLLITDPKASGMEVVSRDPRTMTDYNSEEGSEYYWWDYWWTHDEDRDDHMAFFVTELPKGKHEFRYLIRPELPGEYLIRPTVAEGMYSSKQAISTASFRIIVNE